VFKRVLIELSIRVLPILTVSPPRIAGSILALIATSRPTRSKLSRQGLHLRSRQGVRAGDLCSDFAAMRRCERRKGAGNAGGFRETAIVGKHAERLCGQRIELQRLGNRCNNLFGCIARD